MLFSYSKSVAMRGAVSVDGKVLFLGVRGLEEDELNTFKKSSIVFTIQNKVKKKIADEQGKCMIFLCMIHIKRKKNFTVDVYDVRDDYNEDFDEIFFKVGI